MHRTAIRGSVIKAIAVGAIATGAIAVAVLPLDDAPELACSPEQVRLHEAQVAEMRAALADRSADRDLETTPDPAAPVIGSMTALRAVCTERTLASTIAIGDLVALIGGIRHDQDWNEADALDAEAWDGTHRAAWGKLTVSRAGPNATALADGSVVLTGGIDRRDTVTAIREIELGSRRGSRGRVTWRGAGALSTPRWGHTATLLADGASVLVAGGGNGSETPLDSVELWRDGRAESSGPLLRRRIGHTATLLADGRVLIVGGAIGRGEITNSVEIYDPIARVAHDAVPLHAARRGHTATLLAEGRVMVVGGMGPGSSYPSWASSEIFDPRTGAWTPARPLAFARAGHTAIRLHDGRVLVVGGAITRCPDWCNAYTVEALELWDPATDAWALAGRFPISPVDAVDLSSGQVNLIGPEPSWYHYVAATWTP
jgi:hypothetical protein